MFRPRASITYSAAKASARTPALPIVPTMNGAAISTAATKKVAAIAAAGLLRSEGKNRVTAAASSAVGDPLAEQPARAQDQHGAQHDEGEHVLVVRAEHAAGQLADVAGAQRL